MIVLCVHVLRKYSSALYFNYKQLETSAKKIGNVSRLSNSTKWKSIGMPSPENVSPTVTFEPMTLEA